MLLELVDNRQLLLVLLVGCRSPSMRNVQGAHPFQTQEFPIFRTSQFSLEDSPHQTGFTNENRPETYLGETETLLSHSAGRERGPGSDATHMVRCMTW